MIKKCRLFGFVSFTLVSGMLISSLAFAQGTMPPSMGKNPHGGDGGRMDRPPMAPSGGEGGAFFSMQGLKDSLNLNEEQAKKLHELFNDYRKAMIQKRAAQQVAQIELEELIAEPKLDMSKIEKKAKEKEGVETDILLFRVRSMAKAKEFLSDAQFEKFRMMIEHQMMGGMGHGSRGRHHPGGMGMEGMGQGRGMSPHGRGGMSEMEYGEDEQ